jgi:hypothetical protein
LCNGGFFILNRIIQSISIVLYYSHCRIFTLAGGFLQLHSLLELQMGKLAFQLIEFLNSELELLDLFLLGNDLIVIPIDDGIDVCHDVLLEGGY